MKNVVISRSSNVVGSSVSYSVRFDTTYDVGNENGTYFYMSVPSGLIYQGSSLTCGVNTISSIAANKVCELVTTNSDWGTMVSGIRIEMSQFCTNGTNSNVCSGNNTYNVTVNGVLN